MTENKNNAPIRGEKHNSWLKKCVLYDDYNRRIRVDQDTIGTITTEIGSSTLRHSYKLIEVIRK